MSFLFISLLLKLMYSTSESHAVVDRNGRIIAVLAGKPKGENWDGLMKELEDLLHLAHDGMTFTPKQMATKRGLFPSVSVGNSFGGGSKVCRPLKPSFLS